jgi:hypothetical protein
MAEKVEVNYPTLAKGGLGWGTRKDCTVGGITNNKGPTLKSALFDAVVEHRVRDLPTQATSACMGHPELLMTISFSAG